MPDVDLFQRALGLEDPWEVVDSKFDAERRRLDLRIDFAKGSRFPCPVCGVAGCKVKDTEPHTWRHQRSKTCGSLGSARACVGASATWPTQSHSHPAVALQRQRAPDARQRLGVRGGVSAVQCTSASCAGTPPTGGMG